MVLLTGTKVPITVMYIMQFSNKTLLNVPVGLYIGMEIQVKSNIPTSQTTKLSELITLPMHSAISLTVVMVVLLSGLVLKVL